MSKIITFYNNKGGVSKTTTLFNLAALLSSSGKKVLLVDCDPQCNITELFFASYDFSDDPESRLPGTSIYEALKPRFFGESAKIDIKNIELVQSSLYKNIFLLRGDFEFSMAERYFANAINMAITENVHEKNTYVVLYKMFMDLGEAYGFDYILCDVGPSTGAITRMTVLSCDGFFLPLTPDRFCNQAINVLSKILKEWISTHREISKTFLPYNLKVFPGRPLFYGVIMQNFKIHSAAKAKRSYIKWQEVISENLKNNFIPSNNIELIEKVKIENPFVASIRDIGALAPVAQMFGCAIFDIKQEYTSEASTTGTPYVGAVWQTWESRKNEYKNEITKLVEIMK